MGSGWEQVTLAAAIAGAAALALRRFRRPQARGIVRAKKLTYAPTGAKRKRHGYQGFPLPYPNCWYYLCQSSDLPLGTVRSFFVAGRDLVLFRGSEGIGCLDAFCIHQGVHLGHGRVDRDGIRCPYHEFKYAPDGRLTDVPQIDDCARDCARDSNRTRAYPISEASGMISVFIHADGEPPEYEPWMMRMPEEKKMWYAGGLTFAYFDMHVMEPSHNSVDWYHFRTVHSSIGTHWRYRFKPVHVVHRMSFPRSVQHKSLEDDGSRITDHSTIILDDKVDSLSFFGLVPVPQALCSIFDIQVRFNGPSFVGFYVGVPVFGRVQVVMPVVPVGPFRTEMQLLAFCDNWWALPFAIFFTRFVRATLEQDRDAWEHRTHVLPRNAIKGDFSWNKFDQWLGKFYSKSSIQWSDTELSW